MKSISFLLLFVFISNVYSYNGVLDFLIPKYTLEKHDISIYHYENEKYKTYKLQRLAALDNESSIVYNVIKPDEMKDSRLVEVYDDKIDSRYFYLKNLNLKERVSENNQTFLNTNLNIFDILAYNSSNRTLIRSYKQRVLQKECSVHEYRVENAIYDKLVYYKEKLTLRIDFYKNGKLLKVLKVLEVGKIDNRDVPTKFIIESKLDNSKTSVHITNVVIDDYKILKEINKFLK